MPDETLWSVHVQGGDEYHACASKEAAEALAGQLDDYDRKQAEKFGTGGVYLKPVVKPWPYDAKSHADALASEAEAA